ncbi:hypothetical protein RI054_04g21510 [Pseudoscourfieldia marina]
MVSAVDAPPMAWSMAFGRFRSVFPDAPEEEFLALVRDTANYYGFYEGDLIRYLAVEPGRVRRTIMEEISSEYFGPIDMAWLAKAMFAKSLADNNLKKSVNFVFQIRLDNDGVRVDRFEHSPSVLDHLHMISETIEDCQEEGDPRVIVDPSANFTFSHTANSRVAFEYAPGRLDEFHSAVHRAAAHHGVAIERICLVFAEHGMFWNTPEDEHAMETRGGKLITCRTEDTGYSDVLGRTRSAR